VQLYRVEITAKATRHRQGGKTALGAWVGVVIPQMFPWFKEEMLADVVDELRTSGRLWSADGQVNAVW